MNTLAPDIFVRLAQPIQSGQAIMKKRSPTDKEYFVQDWFEKRLHAFQIRLLTLIFATERCL